MSFKKILQKEFIDPKKRIDTLYHSSQIMFIVSAFAFFLVYFFVAGGFFANTLQGFVVPLYVAFVMSLTIFICCATWKFGYKKIPQIALFVICIVWCALGVLFLTPLLH